MYNCLYSCALVFLDAVIICFGERQEFCVCARIGLLEVLFIDQRFLVVKNAWMDDQGGLIGRYINGTLDGGRN